MGLASSPNKEQLLKEIQQLRDNADSLGATDPQICSHLSYKAAKVNEKTSISITTLVFIGVAVAIIASLIGYQLWANERCVFDNSLLLLELARPRFDCDVCKNVNDMPVVDGDTFSKAEFLANYAYNGIPVLVKGGARNWTALEIFSFGYLKNLYTSTSGALEAISQDCQFFPYKTDFLNMDEVFKMSASRSRIDPGEKPWYVGWSNCHPDVAHELRKHYQRPTFLPDDSESSSLDWLFMGGFGGGADVHIDFVQRPSWQAMIQGRKSWKLVPSPECESVCSPLNATMEKGDIILVDTNMWYHSTYIHPGDVSITIGSEYD